MKRRFFYDSDSSVLKFQCPCGGFVVDESPEAELGSGAEYLCVSRCNACGRVFSVSLGGTLSWKPNLMGDVNLKNGPDRREGAKQ